jgi:hypothetical protein
MSGPKQLLESNSDARPVDVSFDCMPLRSMARLDPPLDASPGLTAKYDRIKAAIAEHGTYNTYFLHNAKCSFYVTNDPNRGMIAFTFEGVVFTDDSDSYTRHAILNVSLDKETCSWLEQHVVKWFEESVTHAVVVEFDRYIGAGDPEKTKLRKQQLEQAVESGGGFVGMHL